MTRASVSDLKAHLSRYLREVRRGGEVQIVDRGVPVARLVGLAPPTAGAEAERRDRLIRAGVLRPGAGETSKILGQPPIQVSANLSAALEEERDDRR
jgi:prevent-host-death family protein